MADTTRFIRTAIPTCAALALLVVSSCGSNGESSVRQPTLVQTTQTSDGDAATSSTVAEIATDQSTTVAALPAPQPTGPPIATTSVATTSVATTSAGPCMADTGLVSLTLSSGGNPYLATIYVPQQAASETVLPVVLNWHGLGSDGFQQSLLTLADVTAEAEGFISVHPTGLKQAGFDRTSWELDQFDFEDRDDLGYANDLIDVLIEDYCADPNRIYSMGMSNGSFFTSRLVCELSDRIAAAASIAGVSHFEDCEPSRAVPFIAFHGTADKVVPYSGGVSTLGGGSGDFGGSGFFDQDMFEEFSEFAGDAGCDAYPETTAIGKSVTLHEFSGCLAPHKFYEIGGGGHTWPGSLLGQFLESSFGKTNLDIAATDVAWEFFSSKTLAISR